MFGQQTALAGTICSCTTEHSQQQATDCATAEVFGASAAAAECSEYLRIRPEGASQGTLY